MSATNIKNANFTPLFHNVLDEHGITAAAVFGRVWQYCQMERGYCHAEQETIAYQLGINRKTVNHALGALVRTSYLSDVTPNTKGRTRIYKDTGKAGGKVYKDVTEVVTEVVTVPVTKSNTNIHKTEKTPTTYEVAVNSNSVSQEQVQAVRTKQEQVQAVSELDTEQKQAYQLVKNFAKHDKALEVALRVHPLDAAYGFIEYLAERGNRQAAAMIDDMQPPNRVKSGGNPLGLDIGI